MRGKLSKDFFGGLLLLAIGLAGLYLIADMPMGDSFRLGPAFLPRIVSLLICGFGVLLTASSFFGDGGTFQPLNVRPLVAVLLGFATFGLLIKDAGLIIAGLAVIFIGSLADTGFRWKTVLFLGLTLTLSACLVFSVFLKLPIPVWPNWS
jgi:hypothetical protein